MVEGRASPIVRTAVAADLARIVELLAQLSLGEEREDLRPPLPEAYARAFAEIEADSRQALLVVEADGRVEGTLVVTVVPNLSHAGRPYAIVEDVVVDAALRGSGYGRLLMLEAIEIAWWADCYKVALTSNKVRLDAHRFYEGLGMTATHEGFRLELPLPNA